MKNNPISETIEVLRQTGVISDAQAEAAQEVEKRRYREHLQEEIQGGREEIARLEAKLPWNRLKNRLAKLRLNERDH